MLAHGRWPVGRDGKSKDEKPEMNEHEKSDHPVVPTPPSITGTGKEPRPAEAVDRVVYQNPIRFLGQAPHFKLPA